MTGTSGSSDGPRHFPATRLSAIVALKSANRQERSRALNLLASAYWRPVYSYLRLKWNKDAETAKDLTQSFFAIAIEKEYLLAYDPSVARFRTFLRTCIDRFALNADKADSRLKRGGDIEMLSFDFAELDRGWDPGRLAGGETPEQRFEKDWICSLFELSLQNLHRQCEAEGKSLQFTAFKRYDLDRVECDENMSYEVLAAELKIDTMTLNNYLSTIRRRFRSIVLETLAQITASDQEYRDEARIVLGIDIDK